MVQDTQSKRKSKPTSRAGASLKVMRFTKPDGRQSGGSAHLRTTFIIIVLVPRMTSRSASHSPEEAYSGSTTKLSYAIPPLTQGEPELLSEPEKLHSGTLLAIPPVRIVPHPRYANHPKSRNG
jgi:hypothetical protein